MAYEQKPNTGTLFKNHKKENEKQPTHTGTINIEGVEYYLNAWVNETKKGEKYFAIKVKPKEIKVNAHNQAKANAYQAAPAWEDDGTIPF